MLNEGDRALYCRINGKYSKEWEMSGMPTMTNASDVRLHLGCGERSIPGYCNVDIRPMPHVQVVTSADSLSMFADNSAEVVYASHLLEHFPRDRIQEVLSEWFRVLKPGGVLRLSVPDFDRLLEVYKRAGSNIDLVLGPLVGRQDHPYNFHYVIFNSSSLSDHLRNAGFGDVRKWDWRTTDHSAVDDYSRAVYRDESDGTEIPISLNLEARKSTPNPPAE